MSEKCICVFLCKPLKNEMSIKHSGIMNIKQITSGSVKFIEQLNNNDLKKS
jgi:hypothetical protein